MSFDFLDFEMPLLKALIKLGGKAKTKNVYPEVEKSVGLSPAKYPEEYETYQKGQIKWKNKTAWAREYLKRKGQLDGTERGIWKITDMGRERVKIFTETRKDPDEGLAQIQGVDTKIAENEDITPEEGFNRIENIQIHETGGILGVRGIVYEPVNEQGVILLFAALCHDLGFMIEGIRSSFPDALLRRRNNKGTWNSCRAEFEYKSSNFKVALRFCASRRLLVNLDRRKRLIMSKKELLISEIEQVPEPFLDEVLDFVHFLKTKIIKERLATAIASESSLKKDWLKPEEDEAWQNL